MPETTLLGGSGGSDPLGSDGEVGPSWSDPPRRRRKSNANEESWNKEHEKKKKKT